MAAYKITSDIVWSSTNFDAVIGKIEARLKAMPPISIRIDASTLGRLKRSLLDIERIVARIGATKSFGGFGPSMTTSAKNATSAFNGFQSAVEKGHEGLQKLGMTAAATVRRFGAFVVISNVVNTISNSLRTGVHQAIEYEKQMVKISQVTGLTVATLGGLDKEITRLSTSLGVSSQKLLDVSLTLAQAGLSANDTRVAMQALAKTELAATFGDIKNTTEATIAIMSQFKMKAQDLEGALSAVNTVSAKFAVEAQDITTGVRTAGGAFAATGATFEQFNALMTTVRATTRESAESIATGIRTITTRLQRPRTQSFLKDMGVDLRTTKGEFIGIYPAIEKLANAMKNISGNDPRFSQILEEIAGYRQIAKVIPLLRNFSLAQKVMAAQQGASNSVTRDAVIAQQSLSNAIVKTKEEFYALIRKIVNDDAFQRMAKGVLGLASSFIKLVDSIRPLIPLLTAIGGVAAFKAAKVVGGAFITDLVPSLRRRAAIGRAKGGYVPGSGSGDIVPAMLEPGEFVIRKSAAQAIGPDGLHKINKYGNGGKVWKSGYRNGVKMLPAPSTMGQIRDLFSKGGLRRSLGLDHRGGYFGGHGWTGIQSYLPGNANYANGSLAYSNQELRYPVRRTGRTLGGPRSSVTPQLTQDRNSLAGFVKSHILPTGPARIHPNILRRIQDKNTLAKFVNHPIESGPVNDRRGFSHILHSYSRGTLSRSKKEWEISLGPDGQRMLANRPVVRGFPSSDSTPNQPLRLAPNIFYKAQQQYQWTKNSDKKILVKRYLEQFRKRVGIDPARILKSISISHAHATNKTASGSYNIKSQHMKLYSKNYDFFGGIGRARGLRGTVNHELAHAISGASGEYSTSGQGVMMSNSQKAANLYKEIFGEDIARNNSKSFTKKRLSAEESFADLLAMYLTNKKRLKSNTTTTEYTQIKKLLNPILDVNSTWFGGTSNLDSLVGLKKKRFAAGGHVPGTGDGDTVPAMLTPGEFVINKKSAQAIGYDKLAKVNRYAGGGRVGRDLERIMQNRKIRQNKIRMSQELEEFHKTTGINPAGIISHARVNNNLKGVDEFLAGEFNPLIRMMEVSDKGIALNNARYRKTIASGLKSGRRPESRKHVLYHELGHSIDVRPYKDKEKYLAALVARRNGGDFNMMDILRNRNGKSSTLLNPRGDEAKLASIYKEINHNSPQRREQRRQLGNSPDGVNHMKYLESNEEEFANLFSDYFTGKLRRTIEKKYKSPKTTNRIMSRVDSLMKNILSKKAVEANEIASLSGRTIQDVAGLNHNPYRKYKKRFADGGHVPGSGSGDTVPALLTPGEFVINKKSAQAIGYHNLAKANKYATGGRVQKFAKGGGVLDFAKKNVGTLATAAFMIPSIVQGVGGDKASEAFKPFMAAATMAGVAMVGFSFALKKTSDDLVEDVKALRLQRRELDLRPQAIQDQYKKETDAVDRKAKRDMGKLLPTAAGGGPNSATARQRIQDIQDKALDRKAKLTDERDKQLRKAQRDSDENDKDTKAARTKFKDDGKWNKRVDGIAKGAAILAGAGTLITQFTDSQIQNGTANRGTQFAASGAGFGMGAGLGAVTGAMAGGYIAKAAAGTAAGSAFGAKGGILGVAIGALVGGIWYATDAWVKSGSAIENLKLDKKIESFARNLDAVNSGRSSVATQSGNINQFLRNANTGYETKKDGIFTNDFSDFKGKIGQSTEALNLYLDKVIETGVREGVSGDKLIKQNQDLIMVLSRFGNQTITDLEKKIKDSTKTTEERNKVETKYAQIIEENNRRLEGMFNIVGAIGDAERSSSKLGNEADLIDQMINGFSSAKFNVDFSSLSDIGSARLSDVKEQATRAGGLIGGPGVGLGQDVIAAAETVRKIPALLNELVYSDQLTQGTDITDRFRSKLGKSPAADLVMAEFGKMLGDGQQSPEFTQEFKRDPIGTAKRLQAAVQPMVDILAEAAPKIAAAIDSYADGLARARENFFKHLDGLSQAIDIEEIGADVNSRLSGKPLSFSQNQAFDDRRGALLNRGRSVPQLGVDLATANSRISVLSNARDLESDPMKVKDLTKAINEQIQESEQTTKALEYSADVNSRLAAVSKEIEKMERARDLKKDMATGYAFGGPEARKAIVKQLANTGQIVHNLDAGKKTFEGVSLSGRQSALELFQQHMDDRVFNGKTGREQLDRINEKEGLIVGMSQEEKNMGDAAKATVKAAEDARKILNDSWKQTGDDFATKIGAKFDKFIIDLRASMLERVKELDDERVAEGAAKLTGLENQLKLINDTSKKTGLNLHNEDEFKKLMNNIPAMESIKELQAKQQPLDDLSAKFKKKGFAGLDRKELEKAGIDKADVDIFSEYKKSKRFLDPEKMTIGRQHFEKVIKDKKDVISKDVSDSYSDVISNLGGKDKADKVYLLLEELKKLKETLEQSGHGDAVVEKIKDAVGLAGGGSIWKKRGSDTVPAMTTDGNPYMLTPGEFVMNRRAVGKYGVSTLEKMNHLAGGGSVRPKTLLERAADQHARHLKHMAKIEDGRRLEKESERIKENRNNYMGGTDRYTDKTGSKNSIERDERFTRNSIVDKVKTPTRFLNNNQLHSFNVPMTNESLSSSKLFTNRQSFQKQKSQLMKNGMSSQEASQFLLKNFGGASSGQELFNVPDKPGATAASSAKSASSNGLSVQMINPDLMKEFNAAINKLAGSKLEISLNGTLNVNVSEGNLNEKVTETLKAFAETYVMDKIDTAISNLVKDANLMVLPKAGKKGGK